MRESPPVFLSWFWCLCGLDVSAAFRNAPHEEMHNYFVQEERGCCQALAGFFVRRNARCSKSECFPLPLQLTLYDAVRAVTLLHFYEGEHQPFGLLDIFLVPGACGIDVAPCIADRRPIGFGLSASGHLLLPWRKGQVLRHAQGGGHEVSAQAPDLRKSRVQAWRFFVFFVVNTPMCTPPRPVGRTVQ